MATNREKYINNASDEEIANVLCGIGLMYRYSPDTQTRIKEWLSQEAEEDIVNIPSIGKMPKTDKTKITFDYEKPEIIQLTKKAYEDILERLDKLEEEGKTKGPEDFIISAEEAKELKNKVIISNNREKSADEMFAELGYEKAKYSYITFLENEWGVKRIVAYNHLYKRDTIVIYEDDKYYKKTPITLAEDRAIHKKIEELKKLTE